MKVLITSNSFGKFDKTAKEKLVSQGWEIQTNPYGKIMDEQEMKQVIKDVDAVILGSDPVTESVLKSANRLKIISRYGVGIDNIDVHAAEKRGITITRTVNANADAVADYTIGLMLSTLRHLPQADEKLQQGIWDKKTGLDLCHKVVGVFGLGAIGKGVVRRLRGFGCTIIAYDPYADSEFCAENNVALYEPAAIFKEADVITLHFPGNADGKPFISREELGLMKQSAVIVNTARASLVDEKAVLDAVEQGKLYGYGTDVFSSEPAIPSYFLNKGNVVLSPHMAAVSVGAINRMSQMAVDHILEFFEKESENKS